MTDLSTQNVLFRFVPTQEERTPTETYLEYLDTCEEYAVVSDPKVSDGIIIYAKYRGEWYEGPWNPRPIIARLLQERTGHATPQ